MRFVAFGTARSFTQSLASVEIEHIADMPGDSFLAQLFAVAVFDAMGCKAAIRKMGQDHAHDPFRKSVEVEDILLSFLTVEISLRLVHAVAAAAHCDR
jgi:hypothetical protein